MIFMHSIQNSQDNFGSFFGKKLTKTLDKDVKRILSTMIYPHFPQSFAYVLYMHYAVKRE